MKKILILSLLLITSIAWSQIPKTLSFQGVLLDPANGQAVTDGSYTFIFSIYNVETGGTALWDEQQILATSQGQYSAILGSVDPINDPINITGVENYWLGINVNGNELGRVKLTSSAYLLNDALENLAATGNITGNAATVTTNANLTGDVTSVGNTTSIAPGIIGNADINASAAIADTKLATISTAGKVLNSATTATNANTANAIVARDASGNFSAGTITAKTFEGYGTVPIGAVIDWWRPDGTVAVPDGFKICDGTVINDAESPWNSKTVPNLANTFVRGVTTVGEIGTTGGSDTHLHSIDPPITTTTSAGSHSHTVDPAAFSINVNYKHSHQWILVRNNGLGWYSYRNPGTVLDVMGEWGDGMDSAGSGINPLYAGGMPGGDVPLYTSNDSKIVAAADDDISVNVPSTTSSAAATHGHNADIAAFNSDSGSTLPSYIGLLKIMRIK